MKRYAKQTALALAMALTVSSVAPATASAATKPSYKKTFNAVRKGKTLTYTVKNIKKGTKVKWSIIGTGKKYVSFNKSKAVYKENTKAAKKKTYSSNKVYVRKNTTKVVKAVVRATVTGKNGKKYTVSDKIAIAKKATTPATTTPASAEPTATAAVTSGPATTAPASVAPTATVAVTSAPATTAPASVAPTATAAVTSGPATTAPVATTPATTAPETSAPAATTTPTVAPTATTTPSATPEVATAAAVSASAVNAKTIAVTFNRELTKTEQEGVKVSVTRDKATQAIKTEFKDAKTLYVTRDADVEFQAATYTVALTGTVEASYDVKVEAPVATSLAINSVVLVDGKAESEVKVALLDQYGVEMTLNDGDFTKVATNKTNNNKDVKIEVKDGKFVIDTATIADDFKVDDQIQITLLHKATGLSATATLKVVESTYVSKITLADTYVLPADTTRLTENTKDVKVYYTAVDNYNQAVDLKNLDENQNEYSIVSTDEKVLDPANVTVDTDATTKETYFKIAKFEKVGKVSLVILSNKSGETSKIDLDVLENAGDVYAAEFETTSVNVAAGSKATINVKLTDRYGDTVEAKGKKADVNLVSSDKSQVEAEFDDVETSDTYGKVVIDAANAKEDSTIVLTATVNGTPTIITVKVGKAAVPSTIAVKTNTTSLIKGSEAEIKFDVKDQYGNTVSDEAFTKSGYKIAVTSNNTTYVTTSAAVDADPIVPSTTVTVKAKDAKDTTFTETVKVELINKETKTADTKTITFTIEPNTTKNLTYTVNAIPALYKNTADVTTKAAVDAGYAQKVVVTAKKANGAEITLPAGKVLNVVSDNENIIVGEDEDGQWYVAGKDSAETITKDVTGKITVVVETDDATTIVTADVTVSKDAKQYNEVKLYDSTDKDKRKEVSTVTSSAIDVVAINNLVKADQFGVEVAVTSASAVSLSSYNNVEGTASDVKFEDGELTISGITVKETDKEASFKATLVIGALTKTITVTIPVTK